MKETGLDPDHIVRYRSILIVVGLAVICAIIYGQTAGFELINIDDRAYIYENPMVLSGLNGRSIAWAFTAFYSANWHPVTWLSHMLDVSLFGQNAGAFHVVNAVFHTIASILAYFVFKRLMGSVWQGAFIAALFAVHPAHVESVAWAAERKDVLSAIFWMLTMLAYFRYSDAARLKNARDKRKWMVATVAAFVLGLMSKPMLVTLPFVLLLCDYWSLGRLRSRSDLKPLIVEKVPLFILAAASSVITYAAQSAAGATATFEYLPLGMRAGNVAVSYVKYIAMMFWPWPLSFWYPFDREISGAAIAGAVVVLVLLTAVFVQQRSRRPFLIVGWLWYLGTLVPVIGVIQVGGQALADRYTYIPYFGLFMMIAGLSAELIDRLRVPLPVAAASALLPIAAFTVLAYKQTSLWHDSATLYEHSLRHTVNNNMVKTNLCLYYAKNRPASFAEPQCTELLSGEAPSADSLNVLGLLRMDLGRLDEAGRDLENAIKLRPSWGILYAHLSVVRSRQGRLADAEAALQKASSSADGSISKPTASRALGEYAAAMEKAGRRADARRFYEQAASMDPDNREAVDAARRLAGN